MLSRSRKRYPFVQRAYAGGGYVGRLIPRDATAKGFEVLPRRWVVPPGGPLPAQRDGAAAVGGGADLRLDHENRYVAHDDEHLTTVAETLIIIAACATRVRRWP